MDGSEKGSSDCDFESRETTDSTSETLGPSSQTDPSAGDWFLDRARFIPLRLNLSERKFLRLLEASLQVSEYTDKIDPLGFGLPKSKRIVQQIRERFAIRSGLVLSADYKLGQQLFVDRNFESNATFYQQ